MVEAPPEFYLSSDILDLTQRQPDWKSLGFVENRNRFIDEEEFVALLAEGPKLRQRIYASGENPLKPLIYDTAVAAKHAGVRAAPAPASSFMSRVKERFLSR